MHIQAAPDVLTCDEVTSRKILAIQWRTGNKLQRCSTCCRAPSMPFRSNAGSKRGCIDAIHTYAMETNRASSSADWHFRPVAIQWRKDRLAELPKLRTRRASLAVAS